MNISRLMVMIVAIATTAASQTNVDNLVRSLDSLAHMKYEVWKVSPDLHSAAGVQGDPTKPGFDDSGWSVLKLGQSIFLDSCWIRKEITVPDNILGKPMKGKLKFLVSVDDYGYLWVNGESKGYFPWDGEFILTDDAKPGQKFVIAVKAINTGGPLRLLRADLKSEYASTSQDAIDDFGLSMRVGQKLLSFDTYQTNATRKTDPGIDKSKMDKSEKTRLNELLQSVARSVDVDALASGTMDRFMASIENARTQLKPIRDYARRFTLYFDSNAHIDATWLWREKETVQVVRNTFSSVLNMMNVRKDFTYTQSSAAYYDWMAQAYPEIYQDMLRQIKSGRWEVVGGMWVEPDCNLPSGESWMRHLLYSKRFFKNATGVDVRIGWNPDSFGYNWNMPQFYANAGIDAFVTQKIGWNDTNVFPYRVFWWEGPDGSRILTYFPFDYVNTVDNPYRLVDWLRQFEANTGFSKMMMLFGVGDHGGGPSLDMLERIDRLQKLDIYPTIEHGTMTQYLDWLKSQDLSQIPVWDDELYLEYHRGTSTTQAKMKESNRRSEDLLTNAEKFSALSTLYGGVYDRSDLETAWREVLFNQFHDILPGSGIRENYIDANEKYEDVRRIGDHEIKQSLERIARSINTSKARRGKPVIVFNSLSWERTDVVTVDLPETDDGDYAVFDLNGKEIASQTIEVERYRRQVLFVAHDVPSVGYRVFELRNQKPSQQRGDMSTSLTTMENEVFRVTVDTYSGWVTSIFDKRNGREVLAGNGNELQILEDKPAQWDAWNIGLTGVQYPSKLQSIEVVESGPVRSVLRLHRTYLKPGVKRDFPTEDFPTSFFNQDIILFAGVDRIDFKTDVDWWEDKTMLKVAFLVAVEDTAATYEIPYGSIRRSTQSRNSWEKAKWEVPAERWADVSESGYGVSLLNRSKYGYDINGNTMRLSLLRSPLWPDRTADRGKHTIEYSLYPHKNRWHEASTVRRGYEVNNRLVALVGERHSGKLPDRHSFVCLQPSNLVLTTVKKAEGSDGWIFQWYEAEGKESTATLTLPGTARKAFESNFLEEQGAAVPAKSGQLSLFTKKNGIVTVLVFF